MNLPALAHELKPAILTLLQPPVPMMILVILGARLLARRARLGGSLIALGLLSLWLSCTEVGSNWLIQHLLKPPPALSAQAIAELAQQSRDKHDVAVLVLGGGARSLVPEYGQSGLQPMTMERLRFGAWLARQLDAPLGFSGGIGWHARHLDVAESDVASRIAREELTLPLRWAEGQSRDTVENARLSLPKLQADGIMTVLLVTHDVHMPRALKAFQREASEQIRIVPAPLGLRHSVGSLFIDWTPSNEGFARTRYAVYEYLGRLAGR